MKNKTFISILQDEIRRDVRAEIEAELREVGERPDLKLFEKTAERERLEIWLATRVARVGGKANKSRDKIHPYSTQNGPPRPFEKPFEKPFKKPTAKQSPQEPQMTVSTTQQHWAVEILRRNGGELCFAFTKQQLKTAWRKAAFNTHPDRFSSADVVTQEAMRSAFEEIVIAYEILECAFPECAVAA